MFVFSFVTSAVLFAYRVASSLATALDPMPLAYGMSCLHSEAHLRGVGHEHTDDARPRSCRRFANVPHSAEITQCLKLGRVWEHGRKVKDSLRIAERQAAGAAALNPMEVEDVTTWLCDTVRLPEYSELFSKYQIGGPRLAKITEPELVRLGVRRSFHAKLICLHRDELGFQRHGALRPSSFRDDASPVRRITWWSHPVRECGCGSAAHCSRACW